MVLVPCFNTCSQYSAASVLRTHRHTNKGEHTSRQKLRRAASFWPSAAVSSWQLANASSFASDNPGPEPGCLSFSLFSPPLWFPLFLTWFHLSLPPSLISLFLSDSGPRRHPILFPSLFSPARSALSSSSSVRSDELVSLQVSSGLSQHGCVAEGREHGGLC